MTTKWSSQLVQICMRKGGFQKGKLCGSVYTQRGVKSTNVIKCVDMCGGIKVYV